MELNKILDKKKTNKLDMLVCSIYGMVSGLHDSNVPMEDMKEIKLSVSKIWRKHHPIEEITCFHGKVSE